MGNRCIPQKKVLGPTRRWYQPHRPANPRLNDEQRKALDALFSSTDLVSIFRGGAGTGKAMSSAIWLSRRDARTPVVVLATQRQQVVDMEKVGFPSPSTVAQLSSLDLSSMITQSLSWTKPDKLAGGKC